MFINNALEYSLVNFDIEELLIDFFKMLMNFNIAEIINYK